MPSPYVSPRLVWSFYVKEWRRSYGRGYPEIGASCGRTAPPPIGSEVCVTSYKTALPCGCVTMTNLIVCWSDNTNVRIQRFARKSGFVESRLSRSLKVLGNWNGSIGHRLLTFHSNHEPVSYRFQYEIFNHLSVIDRRMDGWTDTRRRLVPPVA